MDRQNISDHGNLTGTTCICHFFFQISDHPSEYVNEIFIMMGQILLCHSYPTLFNYVSHTNSHKHTYTHTHTQFYPYPLQGMMWCANLVDVAEVNVGMPHQLLAGC